MSLLFESQYRSGLERKIAEQLKQHGVVMQYEKVRINYVVPERKTYYRPDFVCEDRKIIIEGKGRFGHDKSDNKGAQERQKLCLVKEQHPDWDIRLVFQNASKPIYKGSDTTYAQWATDHGFKWSDKGIVPQAWLDELKQQPKRKSK